MKNKKIKNLILVLIIFLQVMLYPLSTFAVNSPFDPSDSDTGDGYPELPSTIPNPSDFERSIAASEVVDDSTDSGEALGAGFDDVPVADLNELNSLLKPSRFVNENEKIILNSIDRRKIQQLSIAGRVVPNLEDDLQELSLLSGKSVDDLAALQKSNLNDFMKIVNDNKPKIENNEYVKNRLLANPTVLAEYLDMEEGDVIERLETEKDLVGTEILNNLNSSVDKRVLKTLVYLVTPKNQGGAGHYKIKVERISKNYDTERKSGEREDLAIREKENQPSGSVSTNSNKDKTIEDVKADETLIDSMYDPTDATANQMVARSSAIVDIINAEGESTASVLVGDNELEPETVSAHFTGQAVDISEIDDIKCTLIEKKRLGGDKKTPKPPQSVKLLYQTQAGYNAEKDKIDASYNEMFLSASQSSLENMFAALNLDATDLSNQEFNTFGDIAEAIGKSVFGTAIDAPLKDIWNYNLEDMLVKTGGAVLADRLGLPREPFLDSSVETTEELVEALGRSYIERNINLPYGSLRGESSADILENIGWSRVAQELRLPTDIFNVEIDNSDTLYNRIGSRIVEYEFGFPTSSFYGKDNLNSISSESGKNRLDSFFQDPKYVDRKLGLTDGTTLDLRNGNLNIKKYLTKVASARLMRTAMAYPNYSGGITNPGQTSTCDMINEGNSIFPRYVEICSTNRATTTDSSGNPKANWRDEMMNLPEGTIDTFLAFSNISAVKEKLAEAGRFALAKTLEKNDRGISRLQDWLKNPNPEFSVKTTDTVNGATVTKDVCLPVNSYTGKVKITTDDIYNLFGKGETGKGVFKRIGKGLFSYALKPNGKALKQEKEVANSLPSFKLPVKEDDFYKERSSKIAEKVTGLKDEMNSLASALSTDDSTLQARIEQVKNKINASANSLESSVESLKAKGNSTGILSENQKVLENYYVLSGQATELSSLYKKIMSSESRSVNASIFKLESLGKSSYEISVGSEDSDFRFEDINVNDISSSASISEGNSFVGTNQIALFLSGRVDLKEYLKSLGSSKLSYSLNLPKSALKRASSAVSSSAKDSKGMSDSFIRSIAISLLEDSAEIDLTKITAEDLAGKVSINDLINLFRDKLGVTSSKASTLIATAFNLKGLDLNYLINGDFGAWNQARAKAESNDLKMNLPKGTTENFIRNKPLGKYDDSIVSKKEIALVSNKLKISEASLKNFVAKKEGAADPKYNKIYFKSYIQPGATTADGTVPEKQVNGYAYNDQLGEHIFNTYEEAETYRLANTDKESDYIDDIAKGLSDNNDVKAVLGGKTEIKDQLQSFLNENKTVVKDEAASSRFEQVLFEKLGIERSLVERLFKRTGTENSAGAVDFLRILGSKYLSRNVLPELNDNLDARLSFAQLESSDLVNILNGQGKSVLSTIGSFLIDKEQETTPGTILKMIQTNDDTVKASLKKENAFELFGKALGVDGLDYSASVHLGKLFGETKIENVFGLNKGSLKGATLETFLQNASPINIASSFKLPVGDDVRNLSKDIVKGILGDNTSAYAEKSFYDQLNLIETYRKANGIDKLTDDVRAKIATLSNDLKKIAGSILKNTAILSGDLNTAFTALKTEIEQLGGQITSNAVLADMLEGLRSKFDLAAGSMGVEVAQIIDSLTGIAGKSIDSMIREVSGKIFQNVLGTAMATTLGLTENGAFGAEQLTRMVNALKASLSDLDPTDAAENLMGFAAQLPSLFTSHFDDAAGFAFNTFGKIFEGLGNAGGILLEQGLSVLDGQLGTANDNNKNMSKFANIAISAIGSGNWSQAIDGLVNATGLSNILNTEVNGNNSVINISHIGDNIADIATNKLKEGQQIWRQIEGGGVVGALFSGNIDSVLNFDDIKPLVDGTLHNIFSGDFRPLQIIGTISSLPNILGKECTVGDQVKTCLSVPTDFRFDYDSIFASVFGEVLGNSGAEDIAAAKAQDWMVAMTNQGSTNDAAAASLEVGDFTVGIPMLSDNSTGIAIPGTPEWLSIHYPVPEGFPTEIGQMPSMDDVEAYARWQFERGKELFAEATSRSNFQDALGKIFQYKSMDCTVFKEKGNILKGFSQAMMEGSPFDKINILADMFGGFFGASEGLEKLTEVFGTIEQARSVVDFFNSDGPKNVDTLAATLGINLGDVVAKLDSIITAKAPTIFGVNLGEGVAGSLLAFAQTGDIAASFGDTLKSFKDKFTSEGTIEMIGNWADEKLGLPPGTAFEMYQNFAGIAQSTFAFAGVSFAGPWAIVARIVCAKLQEFVMKIATQLIGVVTGPVEEALGLVPGSLTSLVVSLLIFGPTPMVIAAFIITNLIGVYKVLLVCTADGYYPSLENAPDPAIWDNPGFGTFDGMKQKKREQNNIKAAQYKADRLIKDVLEMADKTGDDNQIPTQIMTGRKEDVAANAPSVASTICDKVGGGDLMPGTAICSGFGSRAGLWANPQTSAWTHIGF